LRVWRAGGPPQAGGLPHNAKPQPNPGDCGAVICRECGGPLERVDELGIG
jgi:hypothetical protein